MQKSARRNDDEGPYLTHVIKHHGEVHVVNFNAEVSDNINRPCHPRASRKCRAEKASKDNTA